MTDNIFIYKDTSLMNNPTFMKSIVKNKKHIQQYNNFLNSIDFYRGTDIGEPIHLIKPEIIDYENNKNIIFSYKNKVTKTVTAIGLHSKGLALAMYEREALYYIPWVVFFSSILFEDENRNANLMLPNGKTFIIGMTSSFEVFSSLHKLLTEKISTVSSQVEIYHKKEDTVANILDGNNDLENSKSRKKRLNKVRAVSSLAVFGIFATALILWYTPDFYPSDRTPESYAIILEEKIVSEYREDISLGDIKKATGNLSEDDENIVDAIYSEYTLDAIIKNNNEAKIKFDHIESATPYTYVYFQIKRDEHSNIMYLNPAGLDYLLANGAMGLLIGEGNSNSEEDALKVGINSKQYVKVALERCGIVWCVNDAKSTVSPALYALDIYKYTSKALKATPKSLGTSGEGLEFVQNTRIFDMALQIQEEAIDRNK